MNYNIFKSAIFETEENCLTNWPIMLIFLIVQTDIIPKNLVRYIWKWNKNKNKKNEQKQKQSWYWAHAF